LLWTLLRFLFNRSVLQLEILIHEIFLTNLLKISTRKDFFCHFFKNLNSQVIPWIIISYIIIKFVSISYKICCKKCFVQNILQKKFVAISCKFFFITKFSSIFYEKIFKTKLAGYMSFFSSVYITFNLIKLRNLTEQVCFHDWISPYFNLLYLVRLFF